MKFETFEHRFITAASVREGQVSRTHPKGKHKRTDPSWARGRLTWVTQGQIPEHQPAPSYHNYGIEGAE